MTIQTLSATTITNNEWGTGGDIKNNRLIYDNIPKSNITNEIIEYAKWGSPIVKFGNGNGPTVFLDSGVHGSELPSQVAIMKLINYLDKEEEKINGTIYIIPFVAPKMTSENTRFYNGENLNEIADKNGSVTNNVFLLAKSLNVSALGDYHCTMPGGEPGRNVIFGTKAPIFKSAEMAMNVGEMAIGGENPYIIYDMAGTEYPGALEDYCSLNGIPSITCEVMSPHEEIRPGSIDDSYKEMYSFLIYNNLLNEDNTAETVEDNTAETAENNTVETVELPNSVNLKETGLPLVELFIVLCVAILTFTKK
ncbi:MAG: succinylglutamate desuccinylase/aspartoacylase family protein [Methanobrevibacter sp.]|jgi:predicted deacylase|nr:succinylglutamate desuccinylase/aspartoacylase family protein [Candidatus Methanovirga meridionalis]